MILDDNKNLIIDVVEKKEKEVPLSPIRPLVKKTSIFEDNGNDKSPIKPRYSVVVKSSDTKEEKVMVRASKA